MAPATDLLHRIEHANHVILRLQQVLAGFNQQHIDTSFEQRNALLDVSCHHVIELDVSQGWQFGGWADRSGYETLSPFRGITVGYFACQLHGSVIDLGNLVFQAKLRQDDPRSAKRVGLYDVGASLEIAGVDVPQQFQAD